jgi:hypothetical protein
MHRKQNNKKDQQKINEKTKNGKNGQLSEDGELHVRIRGGQECHQL